VNSTFLCYSISFVYNAVANLLLIFDGQMHSTTRAPWDMNSLKAAIYAAQAGTGDVARIIASCTFKPRKAACTKIISVCGRWKDAKKAREVFKAMVEKRGIKPNTIIYTALVSACTTAEDYEAAVETFLQMKKAALKDSSCLPNEVTQFAHFYFTLIFPNRR